MKASRTRIQTSIPRESRGKRPIVSRSPEGRDLSKSEVPKGRTYQRPGPGDASAASMAAALGTVIKKFGSHNVAALNEIRMGETHGNRAVPLGLGGRFVHVNPGLRQRSLRSP